MDISINHVTLILTQLLASGVCTPLCAIRCFYNSEYRIADCSGLGLDQIPSVFGCTRATFLDLSFNVITTLPNNCLEHFHHVKNLDISSNDIMEVDPLAFVGLHVVTNIDLSQNHITMLPSYVFDDVKDTIDQIHLERNEIAELADGTFTNLTKLTALFLGYNQLTTLSPNLFRDLSALLRLHVNSNRLTHISDRLLEPFHHLKILDLSSNLISEVPSTLFEILPSCMETITLANNRLTYIPKPHSRESSMSPQTLDIRNNNITDAMNITYFFGKTEKLLLEGNPFRCDCSFDDVREWIQSDELSRTACTWTCVHPVTMETVLARDLTADDTLCPETTTVKIAATSSPPEDVIAPVDSKEMPEEDRPYPIVVADNLVSPMSVNVNITHNSFISVLNDLPVPVVVIVLVVLLLIVMIVMLTVTVGLAICLCQTNKRIKSMTDAIVKSQMTPKAVRNMVNKLKDIGTPKSSKNENNSNTKQDDRMIKINLQSEFAAAEVNLPEEECQVNTHKESGKINIVENHLHDKETTLDESFGTKSPLSGQKDGVRKRTPSKDSGSDFQGKLKPKALVAELSGTTLKTTVRDTETNVNVESQLMGGNSRYHTVVSPNKLRPIPESGEAGNVIDIDHRDEQSIGKINVVSTHSGGTDGASQKTTPQNQRNKNKNDPVQITRNRARKLEFNEQSPLINDTKTMQKLPESADNQEETRNKPENPFTDITNRDKVLTKGKGPFELRNGQYQTSSNC